MSGSDDGRSNGAPPCEGAARASDFRRQENEDLLGLAEEAGRLGIFEWQVPAKTVLLSPKFLSLYGLANFDGRYESWRACIFREDRIRVDELIESAFEAGSRELNAEFRITRGTMALSDGSKRATSSSTMEASRSGCRRQRRCYRAKAGDGSAESLHRNAGRTG